MEKIVLFPLNEDTEVLIRNLNENKEYQIVAVSSYYEDQKALELLQEESSLFCSTDFEKCLKRADAIAFADPTMGCAYEGYKERIDYSLKSGKKIYASATLLKNMGCDIKENNIYVLQEELFPEKLRHSRIKEIDVPIISVMGMGENCDKFSLQVKIKRMIEKEGYNVLGISSNFLGKFLGMEILPGYLFSEKMSFPEKIKNTNMWIYQLQKQKKAEVILIGCPSGVSEFEDYETNFYGEIPLIISNAVSIDIGFVTLYANLGQDNETAKKLRDFLMMKFNTEVKNFIISKKYFKSDDEWKRIRYYKLDERSDSQFTISDISEYSTTYIENDVDIQKQVEVILRQFENNFHII